MGEFQKKLEKEFAKIKLTWQQKKNQEGEEWGIKGVELSGKHLVDVAIKIVGAAKKEFPNLQDVVGKYKQGETWLPEDYSAKAQVRDSVKWFVRWFCDGEK